MGSLPYVVADIYHRVIVSAIGDPLCHESKWGYITELFMKEFPDAFFYHISEKYAKLLADLGYWVNDVGAETTLQVCGVGCSSGLFRPTAPCAPCRISSHGQVVTACKMVAACYVVAACKVVAAMLSLSCLFHCGVQFAASTAAS